ncbi:hypothetical protein LJR074_003202 [Acidovorax sp. LjRoot74]|uniref:hypothetical protein n=1 Tax=Acidovorax sp. LjRoot74 TaxID=3342337 RepID=UPI003ED0E151
MPTQLEISDCFESLLWAEASAWVRAEAERHGLTCKMERRRHWLVLERVKFTVAGHPRDVLRFARRYNAAIAAFNAP